MFPNSNFKITFQHVAKSLKFSMGYDRSACKFIVGIESILEAVLDNCNPQEGDEACKQPNANRAEMAN